MECKQSQSNQSWQQEESVTEAINNMTDTKQERNHRQGDTEQSGNIYKQLCVGAHWRQQERGQHGTKAPKQRHKQHRQSPADISQQTTLQCTKDNKDGSKKIPNPQTRRQLSRLSNNFHIGK